jgi:hypothetical protein
MSWIVIGNIGTLRYFLKINEGNHYEWNGLINNATFFETETLARFSAEFIRSKTTMDITIEKLKNAKELRTTSVSS